MAYLIKPSVKYKNSFIEAVKEFKAEGRNADFNVQEMEKDFSKFLSHFEDQEKGINVPKGYVPASGFWLIDGDDFIGTVFIRHRLTKKLSQEGGHIGYEIRPSKRKSGYGSKILALALPKARELGISRVLVTCNDDNIGSYKIIEKNGGVLENKIMVNGKLKRRYWISIK